MERPAEYVQSLERGLQVIRAFSAERPSLTLSEVARHAEMSRAAARRFLLTLEYLGYVAHDDGRFRLQPAVLQLGFAYLGSMSLTDIARAHLASAAENLGESCSVSVLDGADVVYVARATTNRIMSITLAVGSRLPAVSTATGRVLLASLDRQERDRVLAAGPIDQRTPKTETDLDAIRAELDRVREQGWAVVDQELEWGVRSVAVPIRDSRGRVVAAVNASAHASRVDDAELRSRFLDRIRRLSADIERDFHAVGSPG